MQVGGLNTEGENTGDNGGVKQAYLAYSKLQILLFSNLQIKWVFLKIFGQKKIQMSLAYLVYLSPTNSFSGWVMVNLVAWSIMMLPLEKWFWQATMHQVGLLYRKPSYTTLQVFFWYKGEFRTIGPVSNSYEFAKDFNCPIGSRCDMRKMYSQEKMFWIFFYRMNPASNVVYGEVQLKFKQ